MTTNRLLPAFALCVLLLAGCSAAPIKPPAEPAPQPGQCLSGSATSVAGDVVPDHVTLVDCAEPHRYAVFGVTPVSADLLAGETADELLENRAALLAADGAVADRYRAWATTQCRSRLAETVGLAALAIGDVDAASAKLAPAGAFAVSHSLTEEPHWAAGTRSLVCAVRWLDPADASTSRPVSLPADLGLSDFYTGAMPIEARQCLAHGDPHPALTGCAEPHLLEPFVTFDATAVFGENWVAAVDPAAVTKQQYSELDAACGGLAGFVVGSVNPAVAVHAELMNSGWFDDTDEHHGVYCALAPTQSSGYDVTGSLVGIGDAEPQLVPAP